MIKSFSILIWVSDIFKSQVFYEQLLWVTFDEVRPPFSCFTLNGIEFDIEENADYRAEDRAKNYLGGVKQVSFETDNIEDFLQKVETLWGSIKAEIKQVPRGYKEAKFADPDWNIFNIEQALW